MDLDRDTLTALDWPVLVEALAERARTTLGAAAVRALAPLSDAAAIRACFDEVDELAWLQESGSDIPVAAVSDIRRTAVRASKGEVLDGPDLRLAGNTLVALRELAWFLATHDEDAPKLALYANEILVDDVLADELAVAFENTGELSARTYPELGDLRRRIQDLHSSVRETLNTLLRSDALADLLQDDFVTLRNDRYVLPIKSHAKRWDIGIVHGTSGSGQTVFVEPKEVVALNNHLRIAEGELHAAERRILARLSAELGREADHIDAAMTAVAAIDLTCARRDLVRSLDATRPVIGEQGVITLIDARHPVLVLRGVPVVGNNLHVGADTPALVLSGPNAGGKTVSLKTLALCALLVRIGCFVPAAEGSRVDRFDTVLAAIGDAQSVQGDLSSFSGHLLVLAEMIRRAAPNTLLLLDEIASGTDPGQGSALAQAVLERVLDAGPRVVVTTHFARLKALPAADPRFAAAAVEYADGRPTYRVVPGAMGESHALSIAAQMGLDEALLDRARELMDDGEGALADALEGLDAARSDAHRAEREARARAASLAAREAEVAKREAQLRTRVKELEEKGAASYLDRLKQAEKAISAVVADLQARPAHARVDAARASLDALRGLLPDTPAQAPPPPVELAVGDTVRLRSTGAVGEIVGLTSNQVQVQTGQITVRVKPDQLEHARPEATPAARPDRRPRRPPPKTKKARVAELAEALRMPHNTLDLRGQRVEDSLEAIEAYVADALSSGRDHVFILHGHGTGALKQAIRRWLKTCPGVASWAAASADQGGDAYTVARLAD
jgi:DNA mismatch repair protein MutS2